MDEVTSPSDFGTAGSRCLAHYSIQKKLRKIEQELTESTETFKNMREHGSAPLSPFPLLPPVKKSFTKNLTNFQSAAANEKD